MAKARKNPRAAAVQDAVEEAAKTFGFNLLQQILLALTHGATPEQRQLFTEAHQAMSANAAPAANDETVS